MCDSGDKVVSKNQIEQLGKSGFINSSEYGGALWLTKYKNYILTKKFFSLGSTWFEFSDDTDNTIHFSLQQFERYFLNKKEVRKLKLEMINS